MVEGLGPKRSRATATDRQEVLHGRLRSVVATDAGKTLAKRFGDRAGHRLAGFLGESLSQQVRFGVFDVERHEGTLKEEYPPFYSTEGVFVKDVPGPTRSRLACDNYAYLVPFVDERDAFFLKTIIPSRKATRNYLNQGESDEQD